MYVSTVMILVLMDNVVVETVHIIAFNVKIIILEIF